MSQPAQIGSSALVAQVCIRILMTLQPWTWIPPQARPKRHPVFGAVEDILHKVFPLVGDEPQGRLADALAALLVALCREHDARQGAAGVCPGQSTTGMGQPQSQE